MLSIPENATITIDSYISLVNLTLPKPIPLRNYNRASSLLISGPMAHGAGHLTEHQYKPEQIFSIVTAQYVGFLAQVIKTIY